MFDPNYRPALWKGPEEASAAYRDVLPHTDWYLSGLEESRLLFGADDVADLFAVLRGAGVGGTVLRVAERGALIDTGEGPAEIAPTQLETVVDEIGAGDGFAAGFAFGLLNKWSLRDCVSLGNLVAAAALRGTGDWETYPTLEEIRPFLQSLGREARSIL
jgi:2-dehydro-3-deoxygluconokinase